MSIFFSLNNNSATALCFCWRPCFNPAVDRPNNDLPTARNCSNRKSSSRERVRQRVTLASRRVWNGGENRHKNAFTCSPNDGMNCKTACGDIWGRLGICCLAKEGLNTVNLFPVASSCSKRLLNHLKCHTISVIRVLWWTVFTWTLVHWQWKKISTTFNPSTLRSYTLNQYIYISYFSTVLSLKTFYKKPRKQLYHKHSPGKVFSVRFPRAAPVPDLGTPVCKQTDQFQAAGKAPYFQLLLHF